MVDHTQAEDKPMMEAKTRDDKVREAAYKKFLERNGAEGDEATDWSEAEREVDAQDQP